MGEPGDPAFFIRPRALMLPPGEPEFSTRDRIVFAGSKHTLMGRAWSGFGRIERVDLSDDEGKTWTNASLTRCFNDDAAWVKWEVSWTAPRSVGSVVQLMVRATDSTGRTQPLDAESLRNVHGVCVNAVTRVPVRVAASAAL